VTFKLGVDGGGTKTTCLLVDEQGAAAARHVGPGCNPSLSGGEQAVKIVRGGLDAVAARAGGKIAGVLLCMAGAPEFWREAAAQLQGLGRAASAPDSLPVLEAATEGKPGLVLHAGTGSFVAARTGEGNPADPLAGTHYAGGLGWRLGDPGSGYDIGRRGIARGLLELQGWAQPSGLGAALQAHTRLAEADAITRHFYREGAAGAEVAEFAPAVLRAAESGDRAARQAVLESAGELLDTAIAVAARLFPQPGAARAGLSGHILTRPFVAEALAKRAPFPVFPVADAPEEGLRRLVARWRP